MAHLKKLHFAWLDANMYSNDNNQLLKKIRDINNECMEFTEENECLRFLGRGVADSKQFIFIISGKLGEKLVPEIQEHENILSIYIYCGWREKHEQWAKQYNKVKVVTTPEELLPKLKLDRDRYENQ